MNQVAILFAGQGSQTINMGKEFYDHYDVVKTMVKNASDVLGYDLAQVLYSENDLIHQTLYTQPCILVTSLAIYEIVKLHLETNPVAMAGFSLGEYSALCASGVFDYNTIINLIKLRANWMHEATLEAKGGMGAILGMERESLEALCQKLSDETSLVQIANYNCPGQLVISGHLDQVKACCEQAKLNGARRAVMLQVSGGFHTPLMESASEKMGKEVLKTPYHKPIVDVYMNVNAKPLNIETLPLLMKQQISSPVLFEDSIRAMIRAGVETFIEIGPGTVLSGLVKKIDSTKKVISINQVEDLKQLKG
jgi:[acyl-carrier-protein] S-malonyltransferase